MERIERTGCEGEHADQFPLLLIVPDWGAVGGVGREWPPLGRGSCCCCCCKCCAAGHGGKSSESDFRSISSTKGLSTGTDDAEGNAVLVRRQASDVDDDRLFIAAVGGGCARSAVAAVQQRVAARAPAPPKAAL